MEKRTVAKEKLMGMQVIDSEAQIIGVVKDVSFTVGEAKMFIVIETKEGKTQEVPWEEVQSVGDLVLLKPKPKAVTEPQNICPTCGKPLTYIQQYQRWYCYNEKRYVP